MNIEKFSSFFTDRILDNNNISVSDFNAGIKKLYENIIVPSDHSNYDMFIVTDEEKGYPDLIAHKYFGDQNFWYYFLLTNALEDPFTELDVGWAYGVVEYSEVKNTIDASEEQTLEANSRIGSTITLN